jgi:SAM-dependent MidA family methyltransferase
MNPLEQKIVDRIRREGPITFETFMEMALYEPGLGYYSRESTEIGKAGDFYTSHHLHPLFGAMIGKQFEEMHGALGSPPDFRVVEFGAGAGLMCLDIMNYLTRKDLFRSIKYVIVERNPFVREKQEKLLNAYADKIKWVENPAEMNPVSGCVFSNELLDSFPVHVVEMEGSLKEIYVTEEDGEIKEIKGPLSSEDIADYIRDFSIQLAEGYRTEVNLRIRDWMRSVNEILSEGFVLTIDYGYPAWDYYGEDRNRGTLLCYHKHQVNENPYQNIGIQDITSHVNFSSVKKWGENAGFRPLGFCRQGTYLVSLGIDEMIGELYSDSSDYLFEVAKIKRLILPGTIGESHKVMIQYKGNGKPELMGFSIKNQADGL